MGETTIQWCTDVWNPVTGCSKVSQGCKNCYAERVFPRPYPGRAFTDVRTHADRLGQPLRWKRSRRIFVNSMSDLFHEDVPFAFIDAVWAVMALAPQHTFQILTKRPERMREYLADQSAQRCDSRGNAAAGLVKDAIERLEGARWPLPNVWLGVSVEDQETADERIPLLLQTPAAVRFISAEPLLGPIDLERVAWPNKSGHRVDVLRGGYWNREGCMAFGPSAELGAPRGGFTNHSDMKDALLNWVIVGGESGPKARPCDVDWIRGVVGQCKIAGVPAFVKQLGARTTGWCFGNCDSDGVDCTRSADEADGCQSYEASEGAECPDGKCCMRRDRKGGDPAEWPADLRVREFPA